MINRIQIHVCRYVNLRICAPVTFLIGIKDTVAIAPFGGMKLFLIAKINVTSYRKEKLLLQVADKSTNVFLCVVINSGCKVKRKIGFRRRIMIKPYVFFCVRYPQKIF